MKIRSIMIIGALAAITGFAACDKDPKPEPEQIGGKGGSTTLKAIPRHHSRLIDSCMVYIKYNASDMPATHSYDDSVRAVVSPTDSIPYAIFTGLKKGKYYLYGYGWDENISDTVIGGGPVTIDVDDVKTVYVQVTEGD